MGTGKSYTGRQLSELTGLPFTDLDDYVEAQEQQPIAEIFRLAGESRFREIEAAALRTLGHRPQVVACGGGTPCYHGNMDWMNEHGLTVYLKASPELLASRLKSEAAHRPLLSGLSEGELEPFIAQKLAERSADYEKASLVIAQEGLPDPAAFLAAHLQNIIGH